jgi:hypothetical protein
MYRLPSKHDLVKYHLVTISIHPQKKQQKYYISVLDGVL